MTVVGDTLRSQALSQGIAELLRKGAVECTWCSAAKRVLLLLFSGSKEGRRIPADPRPQAVEPVPEGFSFSDAARGGRSPVRVSQRLVYKHRLAGCLFPYASGTKAQAVSSLCLQGAGLSVPGAPVWSLPLPPGLHQICGSSATSATGHGHADLPYLGSTSQHASLSGWGAV